MQTISDHVLRRLEALARIGDALCTAQIRDAMQISQQQLHRLTLCEDFPTRSHIGRKFWVNPQGLLEFVLRWNARCVGLTITDVADLIRSTNHTTRGLMRDPTFPKSLGQWNGRDRWDRAAVTEWHRARTGAKLPEGADVTGKAPTKKKPPKLKAVGGSKARRA